MKQVVVLSVIDFETELINVLKGLKIPVFSKVNITGIRNAPDQLDGSNWFGNKSDPDFSVMYFAFVPDEVASQIMKAIADWNSKQQTSSPMHAYQLQVEKSV